MDRFKSIWQTSFSVVLTDSVATVVGGCVDSDRRLTAHVQSKMELLTLSFMPSPPLTFSAAALSLPRAPSCVDAAPRGCVEQISKWA